MKPWKVLSTRQTYKDRWLSVRTDTVETSRGVVLDDFHVMEYRDWAAILAVKSDGNILVIREYRHGAEAVTIGLPAGSSDEGETDMEAVARRELKEETGYEAKEWVYTGAAYSNWAMQNNRVHFFLAFDIEKTSEQSLDPAEDIEVLEMPYADYLEFDGITPHQCHHAAALHYAERYFAKHPDKRPKTP